MSNLGVTKDAVSSQKGSSPNGNGSSSQTPAKTGHPLENSQQNVAANAGNEDGNEKREITEEECQGHLGFHWSDRKKWLILTVVFWVQISMNFNTSLYFNGIPGIMEEFGVAKHEAIYGAAIFLLFYAFGCELWAPWSEELGRWPVLQLSLFFVNVFQLPVALAPNFASVLVGRALGGLSSAGGSVTLAMVADLADTDQQQKPVAFICQASLLGSIIGPIVGGFLQQHFNWRYVYNSDTYITLTASVFNKRHKLTVKLQVVYLGPADLWTCRPIAPLRSSTGNTASQLDEQGGSEAEETEP